MGKPAHKLRVHIYVQHLLGAGHLVRMKALASALAGDGHRVTLISGGMPGGSEDGDYRLFQLPAVKVAAGDFSVLLGADGKPVSADFKARRADRLLQRVAGDAPQVLVVETFPFGRRQLRFELIPLLRMVGEMSPRPLTLCSLRDILQLRTSERYRQSVAEVNAWFDYVLVHADPAVATLAETFPLAGRLEGKVFHSGYLYGGDGRGCGDGDVDGGVDGRDQVIVSAGGGAVGFKLLETAIMARGYSELKDRPWRLLVGGNLAADQFDALKKGAGGGIVVERNRPDFVGLLAACAVSVSQAGYNTVLDTVAANCRAVLVPFSQYGETEQTCRAEKFSDLGRAVLLKEEDLSPGRLAEAVDRAARLDLSKCRPIKMDGAAETARFIARRFWCGESDSGEFIPGESILGKAVRGK